MSYFLTKPDSKPQHIGREPKEHMRHSKGAAPGSPKTPIWEALYLYAVKNHVGVCFVSLSFSYSAMEGCESAVES